MKQWAWLVAALYAAVLLVLTVPAVMVAFVPERFGEAVTVLAAWPYWIWLGIMLISQFALLSVPVRVASLRPISQGPVWRTILAGGLMAGFLAGGAFLSIFEFVMRDKGNGNWCFWPAAALAILTWGIWSLLFLRASRKTEPLDLVSRQCRYLLKGSILELLIAVPTHIVARYRDYCCAGVLTFIGLTMGMSVMLFAYGPAIFFLFAARWKRLHPATS